MKKHKYEKKWIKKRANDAATDLVPDLVKETDVILKICWQKVGVEAFKPTKSNVRRSLSSFSPWDEAPLVAYIEKIVQHPVYLANKSNTDSWAVHKNTAEKLYRYQLLWQFKVRNYHTLKKHDADFGWIWLQVAPRAHLTDDWAEEDVIYLLRKK